jgi:hypothetical protein
VNSLGWKPTIMVPQISASIGAEHTPAALLGRLAQLSASLARWLHAWRRAITKNAKYLERSLVAPLVIPKLLGLLAWTIVMVDPAWNCTAQANVSRAG